MSSSTNIQGDVTFARIGERDRLAPGLLILLTVYTTKKDF
ncbi:unannotated protein [freshwater metagenome]|uniref:Unannotated protein n=1 Tax=freshwater metagenome TaxID=449393 RepID=A0A6J7QP73_9ZZZZ